MSFSHTPVLCREVLTYLAPERGGVFVDGTLGGGGHAELVLSRLPAGSRLIGIDRDWEAVPGADWIAIDPPSGKGEAGKVTVTVLENPAGDARSSQVVFKTLAVYATLDIAQDANPDGIPSLFFGNDFDKELARVSQDAIQAIGEKDILFMFPRITKAKSTTRLVLKRPKTETSIRKVWLPKTLAYILRDWKQKQDKLKELMGEEYSDYNLVLALETGRPCEDRVIGNQFERLKKSAGLPDVVFHSLRHSSTTYKLKINHGDIKATQGDTGHAQATMVTEVYAHIIDEERKINAQKFETAFYANPDMRLVERQLQPPVEQPKPGLDLQQLLTQLQENPELASQLKSLLQAG